MQTCSCILIFNKSIILKEVKIGFCLKRINHYIPTHLRCFKCQKYGHYKDSCERWGQRGSDHEKEDYSNEIKKCLTFSRTCNIYKRKKEMIKVKYRKYITFLEARKIVESYMKDKTYSYIAQKLSHNNSKNIKNNHLDNNRAFFEKLLQLGPINWPKFQEQLKKLHSAEICQIETQIQIKQKELTANTKNGNGMGVCCGFTENFKSPTETSTTKGRL